MKFYSCRYLKNFPPENFREQSTDKQIILRTSGVKLGAKIIKRLTYLHNVINKGRGSRPTQGGEQGFDQ